VVASGCVVLEAHALLDDCPLFVFRNDERMVVELVACLDGGVVDFGCHATGVGEVLGVVFCEAEFFAVLCDFRRCLFRGSAFSAADGYAVFFRCKGLFQNGCEDGGDA